MDTQLAINEYLEWKELTYPSAARSYKPFLKTIKEYFKCKDLDKLTLHDITDFVSILKEKYKPRSVYYFVSILKDFFKYYPNVVNPHHIKCPRLGTPEIHYLTEDEFELIDQSLSEWNSYELRAKLIHNLLWNTGMRVSELCTINLDNIDLKQHSAKILTSKAKRIGYIMWGQKTHDLLIRYLGTRLERGGDYLFDLSTRQVERIIKDVSENVSIKGITPHKYRHGKAHKVIKDGGTIDDVSFILRHSNPALTKQIYLRLDKDENIKIMEKYI